MIYIHIPFCKRRCAYCDFFSGTELHLNRRVVEAICKELVVRRDYLDGQPIRTIYFGGGTPSQLTSEEIGMIFDTLQANFDLSLIEEVTFEANPDDLTYEYVASLRSFPINRLSMGIQSFSDTELQCLHRRHHAQQAIDAVKRCQDLGFENISIDLMYGLPNQTMKQWQYNVNQAIALNVPHISAYHLTYEEGTLLYRKLQKGEIDAVSEEVSLNMFTYLIEALTTAGFEHYEISNFARPGRYSKHNSAYWKGIHYLGVGPSAHSFNGKSRQWNIASLHSYLNAIEKGEEYFETEVLTERDKYNEAIMTSLRTMWGLPINSIRNTFGEQQLNYLLTQAKPYLKEGSLILDGNILKLTRQGIFISDGIMSDLMEIDEE